mmetsp:Transcript_15826/g.34141  ORF Transcript_15826/g.34141 Transcript_15826/m.34141 type:complete len:155 (-) Transcript_15826:242-706(-)
MPMAPPTSKQATPHVSALHRLTFRPGYPYAHVAWHLPFSYNTTSSYNTMFSFQPRPMFETNHGYSVPSGHVLAAAAVSYHASYPAQLLCYKSSKSSLSAAANAGGGVPAACPPLPAASCCLRPLLSSLSCCSCSSSSWMRALYVECSASALFAI